MEEKLKAFDLIQKEIKNFQHRDSSCGVDENEKVPNTKLLVDKLINILQNANGQQVVNPLDASQQTQTQSSPEQKAMKNSLIVNQISSYMDARSLLKFRQVSRLWKTEGTSQLLSKRHEHFFLVKFKWLASFRNFCHKGSTLSDLMQNVLPFSSNFPCSNFSFEQGRLSHDILVRFLTDFGTILQHLTLSQNNMEVNTLRNVIFQWAPNLKSLTLKSIKNRPEEQTLVESPESPSGSGSGSFKSVPLPNLKEIRLPETTTRYEPDQNQFRRPEVYGRHLVFEILLCAPNLTKIRDPHLAYIPQIISAGKISLVKSIKWDFERYRHLTENFLGFAATLPKLTHLNLEQMLQSSVFDDPRCVMAMHSVFQLGQETLEVVKGIQILGTIQDPALPIPKLPRVTHVTVETFALYNRIGFDICPQDVALSQVLPNLKSMHVQVYDFRYPFFSPSNAHGSLERLRISNWASKVEIRVNCFKSEWLEDMGRLYPNISQLEVAIYDLGVENLPECFKIIPQHFKGLEQLVIEIRTEEHFHDQFRRKMDHALTGLSSEIYDDLMNSRNLDLDLDSKFPKLDGLENSRSHSSILDLKKLKTLIFQVDFGGKAKPLWSFMTKLYAFQPMKKRQGLKVKVRGTQSVPLSGNDLGPI